MKYDVTFTCGHTETVELVGKYADRERKIAYYRENCTCSKCYAAKKAAEMSATHKEVEMHYGEYKNNYSNCKTKPGSYNAKTKTIIVYIPA